MEVAISFLHGREFRGFSLLCKNEIATYHPCMEITLDCYNSVRYVLSTGYLSICLSKFRIKRKSPKWYKRILFHFIDVCVINAFILRKQQMGDHKMRLHQFKLSVATALMYGENLSEPLSRASKVLTVHGASSCAANGDLVGGVDPTDAVRRDGQNHWPVFSATVPRRCRVAGCKARSCLSCSKCRVYLCVKREHNCFVKYHTE
jgi:hypothetical protein